MRQEGQYKEEPMVNETITTVAVQRGNDERRVKHLKYTEKDLQ